MIQRRYQNCKKKLQSCCCWCCHFRNVSKSFSNNALLVCIGSATEYTHRNAHFLWRVKPKTHMVHLISKIEQLNNYNRKGETLTEELESSQPWRMASVNQPGYSAIMYTHLKHTTIECFDSVCVWVCECVCVCEREREREMGMSYCSAARCFCKNWQSHPNPRDTLRHTYKYRKTVGETEGKRRTE